MSEGTAATPWWAARPRAALGRPRVAVVTGDVLLPPGYPHPHASEVARRIAERGMILRVQVGSGVHGTAVAGQDDRDEMGICLEPPQYVTGVAQVPAGTDSAATVPFEQYEDVGLPASATRAHFRAE